MSKKFEKIVNSPHRAFKRAKDKLLDWEIKGENPKIKVEMGEKEATITVPVKQVKQGVKGVGIGLSGIAQFLFWALKYGLLDNHLTRKLEKEFGKIKTTKKTSDGKSKNSKFKAFIKKNPNLAGHISYYLATCIMTLATIAGVDLSKEDSVIKETVKEWTTDFKSWASDLFEGDKENDDGVYEISGDSKIKDINNTVPHLRAVSTNQSQSQFVKQAVQEYWDEIAVALTELETYRAAPKLHSGETRYTNGLGLTWYYWYDNNGKLHQRANKKSNTLTLNKNQVYEQVRMHLMYETLPALYEAIKPYDNITPQMQIALLMVGYQRPADMKSIAKKLAVATTVQQVADAFADVSNVPSKWRDGTRVRRYTCALYAIGAISAEQMLDWTRDSFSMINVNTVYKNGHFVITQQNVEYLLGRSRKGTNTVREFLSNFDTGRDIVAEIKKSDKQFKFDEKQSESSSEKSMALVNKADKKFKKGKYEDAEKLYVEALSLNPDNMEAYSSLALTYKMLGDKNNSEEYYTKCIKTVVKCNDHMNANKSMLLDRRVKAMTYYNAGLARYEMGIMAQESGNIAKAKEQYQLAQKNFKTAKDNAEMIGLDSEVVDLYKKAIQDAEKSIDSLKKLAFKASAAKVKKKSSINDLSQIIGDERRA